MRPLWWKRQKANVDQSQDLSWTPLIGEEGADQAQGGDLGGVDTRIVPQPPPAQTGTWTYRPPGRLQFFHWRIAEFLSGPSHWFARQIHLEKEQRGGFLWLPVLFGTGCVAYFELPREPQIWAFPVVALMLLVLATRSDNGSGRHAILLCLFVLFSGVCVAQLRTAVTATSMPSRPLLVEVTGVVARLEVRANGRVRYTLRPISLKPTRSAAAKLPPLDAVRISARAGKPAVTIGQTIRGRARLDAPPGPAMPGGYDFSFNTWFEGIGATGFFLGYPEPAQDLMTMQSSFGLQMARIRSDIANVLRAGLPGQAGSLAVALVVGDRSGIDEATNEALRRSGLAHILAISGLHMGLVAMTVMALLRGLAAAIPSFVLHYPAKKWAGALALIFATFYLFVSGASVSTQRAYIMVAIMLLAVLLDRRALTMRNVAVAALVVLVLSPHAVLQPGFQMSFAAVAALVACYERITQYRHRKPARWGLAKLHHLQRKTGRMLLGLIATPIIAGLATGLFAAAHFFRIAPLGLVANVLAMPIVTIAVMPLALASMILMPFGLEGLVLPVLGWSLEGVVSIARLVAEMGPSGNTGRIPTAALLLGTIGLIAATLPRSGLCMVAPLFMLMAGMTMLGRQVPDFLIADNGRQIAMITDDRQLIPLKARSDRFTTDIWRKAYQIIETETSPAQSKQVRMASQPRCDARGCTFSKNGVVLVRVQSLAGLIEDCEQADVLVTTFDAPKACSFLPQEQRPLLITPSMLRRKGALALTIGKYEQGGTLGETRHHRPHIRPKVEIEASYDNTSRPWSKHRN